MTDLAPIDHEQSNEALGFLMRGELAAVATYRQAIATLADDAAGDLNRCLSSHDLRATRLAEHISHAGGSLGTLVRCWSTGRLAPAEGDDHARATLLAGLVEGERQGLSDYQLVLDQVDAAGVDLMRLELMPEQLRTHAIVARLCHRACW